MKNFYSVKDFIERIKRKFTDEFFLIFANHYIYLGYFIDRGLW